MSQMLEEDILANRSIGNYGAQHIIENSSNKSTQDFSEKKLNDFFNKFSIWKNRESIRVELFIFLS